MLNAGFAHAAPSSVEPEYERPPEAGILHLPGTQLRTPAESSLCFGRRKYLNMAADRAQFQHGHTFPSTQ